jgi:RecB family exonuclease
VPEPDQHQPWPRAWTCAIVLAVGVFGAHATTWWWMPALAQALFGEIPTPADAPPLVWALLAGYLILSLAGGRALASLETEGRLVRDRHRWQHEEATRERQRAQEREDWQRLQEIRDQLYLDSLSPEERERILASRRLEQDLDHRARALLEAERQT